MATTPEGGAAVFLCALALCAGNPVPGEQCLVIAVDASRLSNGNIYKGKTLGRNDRDLLVRQLKSQPWLPLSYFASASPENGYDAGTGPLLVRWSRNGSSGDPVKGPCKIFVVSSGADTPRPVTLVRNDKGIWKAREWSSLLVGIRPPEGEETDDL